MKKTRKTQIILAVLICAILVAGVIGFINHENNKPTNKAMAIVSQMDTDEKIGQILMLAFRQWRDSSLEDFQNVTSLNDELRAAISDYHLGGVDLFLENCTDTDQLVRLTYDIQHSSIDKGGLPLLICTDQEGGNVTRAKFATAFSGNMALGSTGDISNAMTAGKVIGKELDALGINCNFGPVVDVNSNENNPIIGVRSFSGETNVVSEMGTAMANGLKASGVLSCAKHFPGHGDTSTDSHVNLPRVEKGYEEWIETDGAPFAEMVKNGSADMIMTAHIQYPGLDDTKLLSKSGEEIIVPATMSKTILTDILKDKLGFDGVVITDAMEMDAIDEQFERNNAIIMAIEAGTDIVLMPITIRCSEDFKQLDILFQDIKSALSDGRLSEERLTDAAMRVVRLKIENGILEKDYSFDLNDAISNAKEIVGCKEHREIEKEIASQCIDVDYDGKFNSFTPSDSDKIVCVMPRAGETYSAQHTFKKMNLKAECYSYENAWNGKAALDQELIEAVGNADYLVLSYFQTPDSLIDPDYIRNVVFDEILSYAKTDKIAIIWEYLPYGTEKYSNTYPCFVIYNSVGMLKEDIGADSFTGQYGPAIPAAIEAIF